MQNATSFTSSPVEASFSNNAIFTHNTTEGMDHRVGHQMYRRGNLKMRDLRSVCV
jgi:hypothetical protein